MKPHPFRVTCHLYDGRVLSTDGLFFLDAILYHAWFAKYQPQVLQGIHAQFDRMHMGLPLLRVNGRYAASCGFYTQNAIGTDNWVKHSDFQAPFAQGLLDLGNAAQVNTSSGLFKSYYENPVVRLIGPVTFYGVGNATKVRDLLSYIPALGKKSSAGWGAVSRWDVDPWHEDWSTYSPDLGLMRPMPPEEIAIDPAPYMLRDVGVKPPYWKPYSQKLCYVPNVFQSPPLTHFEGAHNNVNT